MTEVYEAYRLTQHVHDSLLGKNELLSIPELKGSGVKLDGGCPSENKTERIRAEGEIDNRRAYQTLAKDRWGNFHLSTVFMEYGGAHIQHDIDPMSPLALAEVLVNSLFMRALVKIALDR